MAGGALALAEVVAGAGVLVASAYVTVADDGSGAASGIGPSLVEAAVVRVGAVVADERRLVHGELHEPTFWSYAWSHAWSSL